MHTNVLLNGQLDHSLDIVRKRDMHSYNTRNKDTIGGKHRLRYHCFKDFNELERTIRNSASLPIFKRLFSAFYNEVFFPCSVYVANIYIFRF